MNSTFKETPAITNVTGLQLCVESSDYSIRRQVLTGPDLFQDTHQTFQPDSDEALATVLVQPSLPKEQALELAKLMAAAPDLFKALKQLSEIVDLSSSEPHEELYQTTKSELSAALTLCKDALDKASSYTY
ncbi:hypothetical protein [Paenibacillus xylanilyticus]|uniref:Uncharacterized protein n=1 Tax=Paenibacillus xylanilyticus TaxID=248903 RepID=A0A7Y6BTP5_9BACL|nr:hypothetical protein [Paenibacillus xylanilyticus]NUU74601.1 hypothetical protein [Paenibacillus xylanilyticus]